MATLRYSLLFILLFLFCVAGSQLALNVSTHSIQPLLTSSFNLRCSLKDTATPSSTLIGRSVSSTPTNARFVLSIFVFQNDKDIASISEHVPAESLAPQANLEVSGGIHNNVDGEKAFINLFWKYPTSDQGGNFSCHVTAIDDGGHQVTYVTSVDVDVVSPRIDDLVKHIHSQDLRADRLEQNNTALTSRVNSQDLVIGQLRAVDAANKAEIDMLKQQVVQLQRRDNATQADLAEMKHIEHGVINCGTIGYHSTLSTTKSVTFTKPYGSKPVVFIAVLDEDTDKDFHAYYDVSMTTQDTNGFSITCSTSGSNHYISSLRVSWLSLPQ